MASDNILVVTPPVKLTGYSSGNCVGGLLTLSNPNLPFYLESVSVSDKDNQKAAFTLLFLNALPTDPATAYADGAALAIGPGDSAKVIGTHAIATADYVSVNAARAFASYGNIVKMMQPAAANGSLYMLIVTTSTPTYSTASSLVIALGFHAAAN